TPARRPDLCRRWRARYATHLFVGPANEQAEDTRRLLLAPIGECRRRPNPTGSDQEASLRPDLTAGRESLRNNGPERPPCNARRPLRLPHATEESPEWRARRCPCGFRNDRPTLEHARILPDRLETDRFRHPD